MESYLNICGVAPHLRAAGKASHDHGNFRRNPGNRRVQQAASCHIIPTRVR